MINQTTLKGNWNEIKGKLRSHWGQLSNDDIQAFNGNVDQLVGLIERKTGETRAAVEDYLDQLTENGSANDHRGGRGRTPVCGRRRPENPAGFTPGDGHVSRQLRRGRGDGPPVGRPSRSPSVLASACSSACCSD